MEVQIHADLSPKLNFACHQNSIPFIRDLRLENCDPENRLEDILITLTANPPFVKEKVWRIDRIEAEGIVPVQIRDVEMDGQFLLELTDSVRGTITIQVEKNGELLARHSTLVELLAYNEWGGAGYMPELLPAFCMPNDPAVEHILRESGQILRRAGKKDSIEGYQSGSRERIWEITSAIYSAIANLGISYVVPPASYGQDGQKIRLPGQILENRIATCLDTTLLFGSALEQAGLNPVIAMPKGHALVGVWLQPDAFSSIVVDDAESLRKRIQLNEMILIESTYITSHPTPSFSKAIKAGKDAILPEADESFGVAIDVKRARAHQISPIGLQSGGPQKVGKVGGASVVQPLEEAPPLPDFDVDKPEEEVADTPEGRLERWQRRLLDLSVRNPLLNHKATKTSLNIICPKPGELEDKLAAGARISIAAAPRPAVQGQEELFHQRTGQVLIEEYATDALERKQVLVDLDPDELSRRAVDIYRKTQTALQEGGANTLYLALGFLLWKRDEKGDRRFRAPLILLPVSLERKSVRSGVKMLAHDDEPRFNTTLLEMLRKDFSIEIKGMEGKLPEDHSGIDVDGIWDTVRKAVRDAPGFEVVEDVALSHFSFAKYLMWKDLVDRADDLRKSPVVQHLMDNPRASFPSEIKFIRNNEVDKYFKPSDLFCPLPADSSQLAAIATADLGKDFVIIGPPGTGKSQTISNMIAHLMAKGKSVLFVSEKTAALEVVYRRLKEIDLDKFCLQLHSNKARKADVLDQLRRAWYASESSSEEEWKRLAEKLLQLRDQLNRVVDHLHKKHQNGLSPFVAMGIKICDEDLAQRISLSWPRSDQHDEDTLQAMREAVEKLAIQAETIGNVADSPFKLIESGEWSPQWQDDIARKARSLSVAAQKANQACTTICEAIEIDLPDRDMVRLEALAELVKTLEESYRKQVAYALELDGPERIEALEEGVSRLRDFASAQAELSSPYEPMAWRVLNGEDILSRWEKAEVAWWPKKCFERKAILKEMRIGGARGCPNPRSDGPVLKRLREEGEAIDRLDESLSYFSDWRKHDTDPKKLETLKELGQRVRKATGSLVESAQALTSVRGKVRTLISDGNDLLEPDGIIGCDFTAFLDALKGYQDTAKSFEEVAGCCAQKVFDSLKCDLDTTCKTIDTIADRQHELRQWCAWRTRRNDAIDLGLSPLVDAVEQGSVLPEEIQDTFWAAYCNWWSARVIGEDDVLRTFSTPEHMASILKFRELDDKFRELTAIYIEARLSGRLPSSEDISRGTQWGVLKRELQKKRRHKPVRQLIQEIPEVLAHLAPCLMMSPLSVAQYLPPDQQLFDVVIFDEASQITVWDAVGTFARGRQVIVAGDPKQMPPTNFFNRSEDDPDGEVDIDSDLESILDEMLGANIPDRVLNLHYRSRRESLIAFSNSRYYDNSLVTFPAPTVVDQGVSLTRVDGFYARGQTRHNEAEAKAIVAEVVRRLTHPDLQVREMSIGVVTFNAQQQTLIENLLDLERARDPRIERAFSADNMVEPVFVKNLETVQGDERDVVLFSVTYGPDQSGHVSMNFGPLNQHGGERRLNVALTRARSEMMVFSTLSPERIDLSRTQARAVADLKHFLEYAERGPSALGSAVFGPIGDFESPFEIAVARELCQKGWEVHPQIGVSRFRIDLGIVHPDEPGTYLAGIECDGAMYHSSAVARERDKIRQAVLEDLGWTLFRIWSTDWWTSKPMAIEDIQGKLLTHLEKDRQKRAEAAEAADAAHQETEAADQADEPEPSENEASEDEPLSNDNDHETPPTVDDIRRPKTIFEVGPNKVCVAIRSEPDEGQEAVSNDDCTYVVTSFDEPGLEPFPNEFYNESYQFKLQAMVDHVIDSEGPIHEQVLIHRVARHHGFQRAGRQIQELILTIAKSRRGKTRESVGFFFWRKGTVKDRLAPARYKGRDPELRNIEHICTDELRAIDRRFGLNGNPVELARTLGISRLRQTARERLEKVLSEG